MSINYKLFIKCRVCNSDMANHQDLIQHLKTHKITPKGYFYKFYNKRDKYNSYKIEYKSFEQYYLTDFINKRNLKLWLKQQEDTNDAANYLINKLRDYCWLKNLSKAPSQSEIKTIHCLPSIELFHEYCEEPFEIISNNIKLINNFNYSNSENINLNAYKNNTIIADTREQKPLSFDNIQIISHKLNCGDYAKTVDSKLVIERKGMMDFFSTLSGGYDRFQREIIRAKENGIYIVVIVEAVINTILFAKRKFGNCSGDFVMHKMREICRANDNVQFLFCDGRKDAAEKTLYILEMGYKTVSSLDLQYYFDNNQIIKL